MLCEVSKCALWKDVVAWEANGIGRFITLFWLHRCKGSLFEILCVVGLEAKLKTPSPPHNICQDLTFFTGINNWTNCPSTTTHCMFMLVHMCMCVCSCVCITCMNITWTYTRANTTKYYQISHDGGSVCPCNDIFLVQACMIPSNTIMCPTENTQCLNIKV